MRAVGWILAIVAGLSCITPPAHGQTQLPPPGTRARLTLPCDERPGTRPPGESASDCRTVGIFLGVQADSIALALADSSATYDLDGVRQFEWSRGRRSHWLAGAGVGLAASGVAIVALHTGGSTSPCDRSANQDALSSEECLGLSVLGAVALTGVGAAIGSLIRTERWQEIPLERLRVGVMPHAGGGFNFSATVVF